MEVLKYLFIADKSTQPIQDILQDAYPNSYSYQQRECRTKRIVDTIDILENPMSRTDLISQPEIYSHLADLHETTANYKPK